MVSPHPLRDHHEDASASSSMSQFVNLQDVRDHQGLGANDIPSTSTSAREKINDSVYRLYSPPKADMDILFFHGLQLYGLSAPHESTWEARCPGAPIWPRQWLSEDYPDTRVLTIAYDGSIRKSDRDGRMDLYLVVESVLQDLLNAGVGKFGPVIMVGHSFGGLVIKRLCLFLAERKDEKSLAFFQQIRGIFYFATPHQGGFTDIIEQLNTGKGELVKLVKELNEDLARINYEFQNLCSEHKLWHIAGVGETLATDLGDGSFSVIVKEASARCANNFMFLKEDHFSICQPQAKTSSTYQFFVDFIGDVRCGILSTVMTKFEDLEGDLQIMPPTTVGLLESWEGGEIGQSLESNSALGLWGMGGIGKTTLAKAIFNRKRSNFEFTLFVEDVKSMPDTNRGEFVVKLLERVHQRGKQVGKRSGKSILKGKEILVVLDDVDCKDDQDDRDIRLVYELRDFCSPSSRFILTSRNSGILNKVGRISIVELRSLDDSSSERLFRSYALPYSNDCVSLPEWQQECLCSIVKHCAGLPLILEVIGQYLKTSGEKAVWEETSRVLVEADKIDGVGVDVVRSKLKVSYDGLGEEEKNMFIDATTFFQNRFPVQRVGYWAFEQWSLREAKAAWGITYGIEERRWKTLVDRSLVSAVTEDSPIKLHEHLLNFGQWLATNEGKRIQIRIDEFGFDPVSSIEALHERIQNHQPQDIHTIQLLSDSLIFAWDLRKKSCLTCRLKRGVTRRGWNDDFCPHSIPRIDIMGLHKMKNLQYLQLEFGVISCQEMRVSFGGGGEEVRLPPSLVILRCVNVGKNVSFATCTNLVNLFMVHFGHKLPSSLCSLKNLQILHLEARYLKCLPELFGNLVNLRHLTLSTCFALERLSDSYGRLRSLQTLKIVECSKLVGLPVSLGDLESLQVLEIISCTRLVEIPDSFGGLRSLRLLRIWNCQSLVRLFESFGGLRSLQTLDIYLCLELVGLPDSLGDLESLQVLEISDCGSLVPLPDSVGRLKSLQTLAIRDCKGLVRLPDSFGGLQNLLELEFRGCERMESFPDSFGGLQNLQKLTLHECKRLKSLPAYFGGLQNLQKLTLIQCTGMESLPDSVYSLKNLQLDIKDCGRLVDFP